MKKIVLIGAIATIAGCATTGGPADSIIEIDQAAAGNCKYIGEITGRSNWGGMVVQAGLDNAKKEAMERAAAIGATHVSFNSVMAVYGVQVSGKAYRCN